MDLPAEKSSSEGNLSAILLDVDQKSVRSGQSMEHVVIVGYSVG